jgi:hypothetical protein
MRIAEVIKLSLGNVKRHSGRNALIGALIAGMTAIVAVGVSIFSATEAGLEEGFSRSASGDLVIRRIQYRSRDNRRAQGGIRAFEC